MTIIRFCLSLNSLSANPTEWSDTLKQFVGFCQESNLVSHIQGIYSELKSGTITIHAKLS